MRSQVDPDDSIEVIDENGRWARIRIRERQGGGLADFVKASIFLTPDQLEEHGKRCIQLAESMRERR